MTHLIYLAPMQGLTDFVFRKEWQKMFSGIDKYFTPFISLDKRGKLSNKYLREIATENNDVTNTVPQILTNKPEEFMQISNMLADYGYLEVNWNLGCPFPMLVKRKTGAGLLPYPDEINKFLSEVCKTPIKISVKMRLGNTDNSDIFKLIDILNNYDISEIIIHPRIATQMYSGEVDNESFQKCLNSLKHNVVYNGDIVNIETYNKTTSNFPNISAIMIGRALVENPFLIDEIKTNNMCFDLKKFKLFHNNLLEGYSSYLEGGDKQIVMKMQEKWDYFAKLFPQQRKEIKQIKKTTSLKKYIVAFNNLQ
jgi:tRNA-dihydrouridine synthase B